VNSSFSDGGHRPSDSLMF